MDEHEATAPPAELPVAVQAPSETVALTPGQARIEAIADTLKAAYAQASQLKLTPEEAEALSSEFPDEAFRLGAGGDSNLIYIEHAYLRQRLNKVLGIGAAVPIRRREWAEEFTYWKDGANKKAVRVYVDMVLLVRGCVVGEAIGDHTYYPDNAKTNYSDALESAKSNAFRRCCKEFGVGLQAWIKGWGEGWKARNRSGGSPPTPRAAKAAPATASAQQPVWSGVHAPPIETRPAAKTSDIVPDGPTEDQWKRWVDELAHNREVATRYAQENGWIPKPNGVLEEIPLKFAPRMKREFDGIMADIAAFGEAAATVPQAEAWREFIVPFGQHKDKKLGDLDTKVIYGFFMNFKVEETWQGRPVAPDKIQRDTMFRLNLDMAGEHYGFGSDEADDLDETLL